MEEQKKVSVAASIRRQAQQFMEADQDGDQRLDFEEWMAMLPKATKQGRSVEQLRQIFSVADLDGDGTLSLDEYVYACLRLALRISHAHARCCACAHRVPRHQMPPPEEAVWARLR